MGGKRKHCVCFRNAMLESVKALHIDHMDVVVEPGIGWMELNRLLDPHGLFSPLDPGKFMEHVPGMPFFLVPLCQAGPGATIGGMCATLCSGSIAVRYGTMRDDVISLKVVLPNGDVVKTASRARKSAAGEGILGVTMEVTLWPQKIPLHSVVTMYNFLTIKDAADVAIDTMLSGIQVSRVEPLDEVQVRAVNIANKNNLTELPTLIFEFICTGNKCNSFFWGLQNQQDTEGGSMGLPSNETQQEAMISVRRMSSLSQLAELISRSRQEVDVSPLVCIVEGSFHNMILFYLNQEDQRQEAERLNHFMIHTALSMEGI
ncbi:hypothetical protein POTOM_025963 [Populus tomentosa]|uniref:D-lactate dehydrogenase (cytochrome) n=1 Tax=Populus tomentosa TaxID=118781 RepID=A0A8X8CP41_POPTO|nr:hypothetical protein POTOM_025963 [Populus tomentosa]